MKKSIVLSAAMLALLATSGMASAADAFPYVKAANGSSLHRHRYLLSGLPEPA